MTGNNNDISGAGSAPRSRRGDATLKMDQRQAHSSCQGRRGAAQSSIEQHAKIKVVLPVFSVSSSEPVTTTRNIFMSVDSWVSSARVLLLEEHSVS